MTQLVKLEELDKIQSGIEVFETKKDEAKTLALRAAAVNISDINDKEGFKILVETRKSLKSFRVEIQKQGKSLRDLITPVTKMISAKENELVDITEPEEKRLLERENWVNAELERIKVEAENARKAKIQARIDELAKYNVAFDFFIISEMSDELYTQKLAEAKQEFETEQKRIADEKEAERLAKEEEDKRQAAIAEQNRLDAEKLANDKKELERQQKELQAERDRIQAEKDAVAKAKQDAIDAENKRIADAEAEKKKQAEIEKAKKEAADKALADQKAKEERDRIAAERKAARQPDKVKLEQLAVNISDIDIPLVKSEEAREVIEKACEQLNAIVKFIKQETEKF